MSEILSYEKFVENLRGYLLDSLNLLEEQIFFVGKNVIEMTSDGDRLFVECNVSSEGKKACGIHTEEVYEDYLGGVSIKVIGDTVTNEIMKLRDCGFFGKVQNTNDYSKIKGDLFIRLLNKKRHEKALENAVYKEVDDIACVVYMKVDQRNGHISGMKIHKDNLAEWGMDEEEVYKNALLNTYFLTPPRIYQEYRLILEPGYKGEDFTTVSCDNYRVSRICKCEGYGLSTSERTNGAVAIFFPGVAQKLSEIFEDSFYIVFVKSYAVMVYPKKRCNPEVLKKRLKDTFEEDALEEDFLSDEIYYYDRGTRKIAKWNKTVSKVTLIADCVEIILV